MKILFSLFPLLLLAPAVVMACGGAGHDHNDHQHNDGATFLQELPSIDDYDGDACGFEEPHPHEVCTVYLNGR